jgi:hypothetical protein
MPLFLPAQTPQVVPVEAEMAGCLRQGHSFFRLYIDYLLHEMDLRLYIPICQGNTHGNGNTQSRSPMKQEEWQATPKTASHEA